MRAPANISESRLASVVGPHHVALEPEILSQYEAAGVSPACVARPGSAEEVAELVRIAAAENLAVIAAGGCTKLRLGLPPARYDVAIDMTRLARIVAYDPGDLTLSVEAGAPLREIEAALAGQGQFLPMAVPFFERTTAGGTVASDVDTPLRQLFGTARDYILGMEFVTGEGVVARSGGRVVKNVTGYDLHKLMIGALGSLGIMTKINFRTFPLPAAKRGFVAAFESAGAALDLRHRIAKSPLAPLTLEILSPGCGGFFFGSLPVGAPEARLADSMPGNQWALVTSYVGSERVLARHDCELQRMASEAGASSAEIVADGLGILMNHIQEFIPATLEASPAAAIMKLSVLPSRIAELVNRALQEAESAAIRSVALARGLGVIYVALLPADSGEETLRKIAGATERISNASTELGGNCTIPWCPVNWKSTLHIWGPGRAAFAQMKKLKNVFDPRRVLAPGRFIGGL